ncbi:hypothetical protein GCM10027212_04870 [Actinotalea caeni]
MRGPYHVRVARLASRLTHRVLAPLAGLALAGALMTACAPAPGAAATVDGRPVGENAVATVVDELAPYFGGQLTPTDALRLLITAPTYIDVAAEAGVGLSEQDAEEVLLSLNESVGSERTEFSDASLSVVRRVVAETTFASSEEGAELADEAAQRVADLDVTVSPRYGEWDGSAVSFSFPEWIEQPAPEAA